MAILPSPPDRVRCEYCHRHVKPHRLRIHQRRSLQCRGWQVIKGLEAKGFSPLKVEDPLWPRFRVYPPLDPKPWRVVVHWDRRRRYLPGDKPYFCEPYGTIALPAYLPEFRALEKPGLGPEGMARAYVGPRYLTARLSWELGVWVHDSIAADLKRALEHAMAEEIIRGGGAIPYKNYYKPTADSLGIYWFGWRMGHILANLLDAMDLSTLLERYREGTPLAEVPDKENDTRLACPYCGKKVDPRRMSAHQQIASCVEARHRKEGMVPVMLAYNVDHLLGRIVYGLRRFGIKAELLRSRDHDTHRIWVRQEQAGLAQRLVHAAIDQAEAEDPKLCKHAYWETTTLFFCGDGNENRRLHRRALEKAADKLMSGDELSLLVAAAQSGEEVA